ncbi:inversin-like [Patiria miniata]|uniref:Inversin n=1 Tax=Patiria miniata TaxID=46514 RepID=A0A914B8U0_PATMI|nr:inversin-like [Patiria miniata]
MGQAFVHHCPKSLQMRSGRVHAEQDINMPASDNGPTMQQQQGIMGSIPSLQRGSAQSTHTHAAAVNGDKSALSKLLNNSHDDIDAGDQFGRTPLMLTVLADRLECAELLIKHSAKVNSVDNAGRTAFHWAAYKGNLRLCKLLLAKGANWRIKDKEGQSALHLATRHDNTKCLMLLIKQLEPGEQDEQDNAKRTALHWSSSYGNEEAVKLLIKHNSNIGIPDVDGKTPLHWAASAGHDVSAVNTVQLILDTEPSVITWQDYEGRTALHLAVAQGNETIAQQLINFQTSLVKCNVSVLDNMFRTPLHWAAVLGHTHIVELLLDAGANVTSSDANGATPLHYAAQNNHADTVAAFLSREGITDEPDLEGRTALMWAAGKGADEVIVRMVEISQPDINATDKTGATALHAAAMCGHPSTIQVLLELGANVNMLDQSKHTPLFRAAEMGHTLVAKALVQGGAHVDILDQEGRSPLHWAALGGHTCICSILISEDVDPNIQDFSGRTPLQCASYGGFTNSISLLLDKEADPNSQDIEGMTALHWCCSSGYLDAAKLLLDNGAFPNHIEYTEDRLTPLDYALLNEHHHVAQYMIEQGALSITGIRDMAAIRVQAYFRGYRVRKTFVERKQLLMKHEQLRKDAAKKRVEMTKKIETEETSRKDIGNSDSQMGQVRNEEEVNDGESHVVHTELQTTSKLETELEPGQPKRLCWEAETQKASEKSKEDTEATEEKCHPGDQTSSDSGRTSDFITDDEVNLGLGDSDHKRHKKDPVTEIEATGLQNSRSSEVAEVIGKSEIDFSDTNHQTDTPVVNANSNNSNSNLDFTAKSLEKREVVKYEDSRCLGEPQKCTCSMGNCVGNLCGMEVAVNRQASSEDRQQSVEMERRRVWRRRSDAAAVIQRAWRNFKQRQQLKNSLAHHHRVTRHPNQQTDGRTDPKAHCRTDPRPDTQQARRGCTRSRQQSALASGNTGKPQLNALRQALVMSKIYGKKQSATKPQRTVPFVHRARPQYQRYIPSAVALSFNFAIDQYRPTVQNVRAPSSLQQLNHRWKTSPSPQNSSSYIDQEVRRPGSGRSSKNARSFSYNHY